MEKLGSDKTLLDERILKLKGEELSITIPTDAITYERLLAVLRDLKTSGITTTKKQRIILSLIEKIEIFPDRLEIHYGLGRSKIKRELELTGSLIYFAVDGSTSLTFGGTVRR